MKILWVLSISVLLAIVALPIQAEIYKWTDDKGGVHFTEDPATIPEKHRDSTKSRPTKEDGMTIEQRRQENKRNEAEAIKQGEKQRTEYQKSIIENETRTKEKQLRDQAEENRVSTEQQEKAHRQIERQIENIPEYVREGCAHCRTTGQVRCWTCRYDPAFRRQCYACGGTGWIACSDCNGKGYIMKRIR